MEGQEEEKRRLSVQNLLDERESVVAKLSKLNPNNPNDRGKIEYYRSLLRSIDAQIKMIQMGY